MSGAQKSTAAITEAYYDSRDADEFYYNVWGGEDIHIGIYTGPGDSIYDASRRTVEQMIARVPPISAETRALDLGSGYGGAARTLAERFGCQVTCLNLSGVQNQRNRARTAELGLNALVDVVHGRFEEIPLPDDAFDLVWSQDAILHSDNRCRVLAEIRRVLAPGGQLVFTDPMQSDDCPPGVLQAVYDRIHLESLSSFGSYRRTLRELGFVDIECIELTEHLVLHYSRVSEELSRRYDEMVERASRSYVDNMLEGLSRWVEAGQRGYLAWGIIACRGG